MKQKVFEIIIKHSRTSMQDSPAQKVGSAVKNSLVIDCEESLLSGSRAHIFLQLTTMFDLSFAISTFCCPQQECIESVILLCRTSFNLYPLMFCVGDSRTKTNLPLLGTGIYLFFIFNLVSLFWFLSCSILVLENYMDDSPQTLWKKFLTLKEHCAPSALSALPVEMLGKQCSTLYAFDKHRTLVLRATFCMMGPRARFWWPLIVRQCRQPCCKRWH